MKLTIYELSKITGKHRTTVEKHLSHLRKDRDGKYESTKALQCLYVGDTGPTHSEALRRLAIAREAEIQQNIQIRRGSYIPKEKVEDMFVEWLAELKRLVLQLEGTRVTRKHVTEMIYRLRDFVLVTTPPGIHRIEMRKRGGEDELDDVARHIEFMEEQMLKDRWHADCQAAGDKVREVYHRSHTDKSEECLAELKAARAEYAAALDRDPDPPPFYEPEEKLCDNKG